jgi:hypothetical protein
MCRILDVSLRFTNTQHEAPGYDLNPDKDSVQPEGHGMFLENEVQKVTEIFIKDDMKSGPPNGTQS